MPTPSYYIFSIWVSCGLAVTWRARIANETALEFASLVFCVALVMAQVRGQVFARVDRSNSRPVTELILPALEEFPKDAIVISRWERYAPLLYFQQVYGVREDVTLVVSDDFLNQIRAYSLQSPGRAILIDNHSEALKEKYTVKRYFRRWFILLTPTGE
jgi:hypothetical protein